MGPAPICPEANPEPSELSSEPLKRMCTRLSTHERLVLPASLYHADHTEPRPEEAQAHLIDLATRNPAALLQRYGALLSQDELQLFQHLRSDYEVNHWLVKFLRPAPIQAPGAHTEHTHQSAQAGIHTHQAREHAAIRNRRLAAMQQLQSKGEFFEFEAMRQRAPLLYHQMVGRYLNEAPPTTQDADGVAEEPPAAGRPGSSELLSEFLLRQHDEAQLKQQFNTEQQAEDEQMSEHDSDDNEDDDSDGDLGGEPAAAQQRVPSGQLQVARGVPGGGPAGHIACSPADLLQKRKEFQQEMEHRFLFGQDTAFVNYQEIDQDLDGKLDDHWLGQVARDAEEAYFDDDDDEQDDDVEGGVPSQERKASRAAQLAERYKQTADMLIENQTEQQLIQSLIE